MTLCPVNMEILKFIEMLFSSGASIGEYCKRKGVFGVPGKDMLTGDEYPGYFKNINI